MKQLAALVLLSLMVPAFADLDDDLFYSSARPKVTTVRSFTHEGKVYGNVRIMGMEGSTVTLHTKQGTVSVPFASLPKLWQDAMHRRDWPAIAAAPKKQPGYKTLAAWERGRSEAELIARKEAQTRHPRDFNVQLFVVDREMRAWETLYPRPAAPVLPPVPRPSPAEDFPPGPETNNPFLTASQRYWDARDAAEAIFTRQAGEAYPNTPASRDLKKQTLLKHWDTRYPAPSPLDPRDQ